MTRFAQQSTKCAFPAIARITRPSLALVRCSLSILIATNAPPQPSAGRRVHLGELSPTEFGAAATVNRPSANLTPGFNRLCGCANDAAWCCFSDMTSVGVAIDLIWI